MCSMVTLLLVLLLASSYYGYNVDLQSPLIINSGLTNEQQKDYSFGIFSLSHHIFSNGDKVLLVGAPGAEYKELREGGVYVCPLVHQETCKMNTAFNSKNNTITNVFAQKVLREGNESFDNQMLGYTIRSSENSVMVCAPFYIGSITITDMRNHYVTNGRCIAMPQDFDNYTTPTQLYKSDFHVAGIGGVIKKLNPDNLDVFSIGSIYAGDQGEIFTLEPRTNSVGVRSRTSHLGSSDTSLYGYHVELGRFLQNSSENLLASGPKASRHRGQVIAYQENGNSIDEIITITAPVSAIDGYFGYDFTLIDLQTDNYESLVVGCPLCDRDKGEVYVYVHTGNPANPIDQTTVQIISSPNEQRVQFGTAVENIGDIDQDGYEDVAISAPYQDLGVVYIYRGGPNGLITDDYQVIPAPAGTIGFGYAITAAIDVDDNMYPDFTVGDLINKEVYTFRSSPVISVTITTEEDDYTLDYTKRNCFLQGIPSICFFVTPCFNFSTKYGGVNEFAVKYTLIVDEIQQRVGLLDNILANRVTNETIINNNEDRTCATSYKFVLVPDFSRLDPIPIRLTITNADSLLPLPSSSSELYGGDLHPILSKMSDGTSLEQQILPNYVQNCGQDGFCDPIFHILVTPMISSSNGRVPWASGFTFTLDITLQNTNEDSLASVMYIDIPKGIRLRDSESISDFAISSCDSPAMQIVRCSLKNPIFVNEFVRFNVSFRPDVLNDTGTLDVETLVFKFTINDTTATTRGADSISLSAQSVASYEIESSFGAEEEQASRFVPSLNQSDISLSSQGPSVNYQITVRHTGYDDEESPIPSLTINVIWPSIITLNEREELPLLVPTRIVIIGSDSTTCRQLGAIPNDILNNNQQSPLVLSNITNDAKIKRCPENVTCGIIQCEVLNLAPQRRDISTATPPVQISIFSTLWSAAIRDTVNVSIYVDANSGTEYPNITKSVSESLTSIKLQPAVTETQRECFQLWIVVVSVLGGLILAFILVAILGFCGCFGRSQYKKKKEEQQRQRRKNLQQQQTDGTLDKRTIPPIASYRNSLINAKETEFEEEMKTLNVEGENDQEMKLPETFAPYPTPSGDGPPPNNDLGDITDETVQMAFPGNVSEASPGTDDLETEI